VVENIYTDTNEIPWFGIRGLCAVKDLAKDFATYADRIIAIASPLIRDLRSRGYTTEKGWCLAYKYCRSQMPHGVFDRKDRESMVRLMKESEMHYPTAKSLANILMELFLLSQPTLDKLNELVKGETNLPE
jgi:hypothetical protein